MRSCKYNIASKKKKKRGGFLFVKIFFFFNKIMNGYSALSGPFNDYFALYDYFDDFVLGGNYQEKQEGKNIEGINLKIIFWNL